VRSAPICAVRDASDTSSVPVERRLTLAERDIEHAHARVPRARGQRRAVVGPRDCDHPVGVSTQHGELGTTARAVTHRTQAHTTFAPVASVHAYRAVAQCDSDARTAARWQQRLSGLTDTVMCTQSSYALNHAQHARFARVTRARVGADVRRDRERRRRQRQRGAQRGRAPAQCARSRAETQTPRVRTEVR
jgi:hypothetical protein